MKVVLAIILCLGCSLVSYIVGHWNGYSLGVRLETTGAMSFLMVARGQLENGETAAAVGSIDKGLAAESDVLLKLERPGMKPGMIGNAFGAGAPEKIIANLRGLLAEGVSRQRTPLPASVYQLLKLPVVAGNSVSSSNGTMPVPLGQESGAPAPPSTTPTPAPKQPQLPPGIERRQR